MPTKQEIAQANLTLSVLLDQSTRRSRQLEASVRELHDKLDSVLEERDRILHELGKRRELIARVHVVQDYTAPVSKVIGALNQLSPGHWDVYALKDEEFHSQDMRGHSHENDGDI